MKSNNLLHYKGYSARLEYSAGDKVFYGKILDIDDPVDFYSEDAEPLLAELPQRDPARRLRSLCTKAEYASAAYDPPIVLRFLPRTSLSSAA